MISLYGFKIRDIDKEPIQRVNEKTNLMIISNAKYGRIKFKNSFDWMICEVRQIDQFDNGLRLGGCNARQ